MCKIMIFIHLKYCIRLIQLLVDVRKPYNALPDSEEFSSIFIYL